jgi:hypothetical protein
MHNDGVIFAIGARMITWIVPFKGWLPEIDRTVCTFCFYVVRVALVYPGAEESECVTVVLKVEVDRRVMSMIAHD